MSLIIIGRDSSSLTVRCTDSPMTDNGGITELLNIVANGPIRERESLQLSRIVVPSEIVESLIITFSPI